MLTGIVIPVFNRRETTLRCLGALASFNSISYRIFVVDSGSTDGTREAILENYPDVILLESTPESWWAAATNMGISEAIQHGCDYILTYNDDNFSTEDNIQKMVDSAKLHPDTIISSVICSLNDPDMVLFAGRRQSRFTDRSYFMDRGQSYDQIGTGLRKVDWLHGQCTLFPVAVFKTIGFFDEKTFPHLYADDDLILRARQRGYTLLVNLDSVVFNDEKQTGLNPYYNRITPGQIPQLFTSRKSFFQLSTKTRFLWRHRRNIFTFIITWIADYCRLLLVIILKWIMPDKYYKKLEKYYMRMVSA